MFRKKTHGQIIGEELQEGVVRLQDYARRGVAVGGAFDVRRYDSESQSRAALLATRVQGVLIPGLENRILVARALGLAPTEAVTDALSGAAAAAQPHPRALRRVRARLAAEGRRRALLPDRAPPR